MSIKIRVYVTIKATGSIFLDAPDGTNLSDMFDRHCERLRQIVREDAVIDFQTDLRRVVFDDAEVMSEQEVLDMGKVEFIPLVKG